MSSKLPSKKRKFLPHVKAKTGDLDETDLLKLFEHILEKKIACEPLLNFDFDFLRKEFDYGIKKRDFNKYMESRFKETESLKKTLFTKNPYFRYTTEYIIPDRTIEFQLILALIEFNKKKFPNPQIVNVNTFIFKVLNLWKQNDAQQIAMKILIDFIKISKYCRVFRDNPTDKHFDPTRAYIIFIEPPISECNKIEQSLKTVKQSIDTSVIEIFVWISKQNKRFPMVKSKEDIWRHYYNKVGTLVPLAIKYSRKRFKQNENQINSDKITVFNIEKNVSDNFKQSKDRFKFEKKLLTNLEFPLFANVTEQGYNDIKAGVEKWRESEKQLIKAENDLLNQKKAAVNWKNKIIILEEAYVMKQNPLISNNKFSLVGVCMESKAGMYRIQEQDLAQGGFGKIINTLMIIGNDSTPNGFTYRLKEEKDEKQSTNNTNLNDNSFEDFICKIPLNANSEQQKLCIYKEFDIGEQLSRMNIANTSEIGLHHLMFMIINHYQYPVLVLKPAKGFSPLAALVERRYDFSEKALLITIKKTAEILVHLWNMLRMLHLDVSLKNVLYNGNDSKLIDFGSASKIPRKKTSSKVKFVFGAKPFKSPEACENGVISQSCEIYSLGVIMYICFSGGPFMNCNVVDEEYFDKMMNVFIREYKESEIPLLIKRMTRYKAKDRINNYKTLIGELERLINKT